VIKKISKNKGIDIARLILLWGIHKGYVMLPKSETESRIANNIQLNGLSLNEEEIAEIDELGKTNSSKVCWDPKNII
jgi:diketogulonate reductase-like aldo/keto reductase